MHQFSVFKQWADLNSLRAAYTDMKSKGDVPENFKDEDIKKYPESLREEAKRKLAAREYIIERNKNKRKNSELIK